MNIRTLACAAAVLVVAVAGVDAASATPTAHAPRRQFMPISEQRDVKRDLAASIAAFNIPAGLTWDGRYLTTLNADTGVHYFRWDFVNFTDGPVYLAPGLADGNGLRVHQGDHVLVYDLELCGPTQTSLGFCAPDDLTDTSPGFNSAAWYMIQGAHWHPAS